MSGSHELETEDHPVIAEVTVRIDSDEIGPVWVQLAAIMRIRSRSALLHLCLLILVVGAPAVLAQSDPAQPEDQAAEVVIDGRAVLRVRGIKGYGAELRASLISERLVRLASDPYFNPASITVVESDISSDIVSSDNILMSVFDVDAQAEGQDRQALAAVYARLLQAEIDQYRRDHSYGSLLKASLLALLATLALTVALFLIQRLYRKIESEMVVWSHTRIVPTLLHKSEIIRPEQMSSLILGVGKFIRLAAVLVLLYFYIGTVFSFFPATHALAGGLLDFVIGPLKTILHALRIQVPKLFFIFILALITKYALKLIRAFFDGVERGAIEISGFDKDWSTPTYKLVRILAIAFAVTIAYPYIPGSDSDAFKGVSIFLGVLVSLGSTSLVSNVVAGLTLTYMGAFKIGDRVKIDDYVGDVVATGLQATHIKTPKNEIVSVPNSLITTNHVTNYSVLARKQGLILHTTAGIGYDTPWRQVHAMLVMAAEKTPGLLREPRPFVFQKSLDDFCVTYELNAYTDRPHEMGRLYSNLHRNIQDLFNEYGVQIMTPAYRADKEAPVVVPKENWHAAPADQFSEAEEEIEDRKPSDAVTPA
jgi:small-conductance mechanosensitive channel